MTLSDSNEVNEGSSNVVKVHKLEWHLVFILYASEHIKTSGGELLTQECVYLIKSSTPMEAYVESLKWASPRQIVPVKNSEAVELPFLGITEVMPIWESLEHGSELGYRDGVFESWEELKMSILQIEDLQPSPLE